MNIIMCVYIYGVFSMKKQLILVAIFLCVMLQSNLSWCSGSLQPKKQTWGEWLSSIFTYGRPKERALGQMKEDYPISALGSIAGYAVASKYPQIQSHIEKGVKLNIMAMQEITGLNSLSLGTIGVSLFFSIYAVAIGRWITLYKTGKFLRTDALLEIKNYLRIAIGNQLLYPTRSSKINVLIKKDEFLEYINDQDDLLNEACRQLIEEINTDDYPEDQENEDKKINKYISNLKVSIDSFPSLESKINALKRMENQQETVEKMRGYLSLYYRLQNKLEVEKKLAPEQKKLLSKSFSKLSEEKMRQEELNRLDAEQYSEPVIFKPQ